MSHTFTIGDIVRCKTDDYYYTNRHAICQVISFEDYGGDDMTVRIVSTTETEKEHSIGRTYEVKSGRFELVKKGTKVKPYVPEHHVILKDSCNNYEQKFDSYESAKSYVPSGEGTYTIYKLVPVARIERKTILTKLGIARRRVRRIKK